MKKGTFCWGLRPPFVFLCYDIYETTNPLHPHGQIRSDVGLFLFAFF
ncbi:hypothetical protein PP244_gp26 [Streptococcus phage P7632]|nr:hypothetical protein PP244_gp26 [Streptococcus phage P7632]ARU14117.1 hypothetical protein P7632_26 [Streptococcus phage P7632]